MQLNYYPLVRLRFALHLFMAVYENAAKTFSFGRMNGFIYLCLKCSHQAIEQCGCRWEDGQG
jgi:hypothetical protein